MFRNAKYWIRRLGSMINEIRPYMYHIDLRPISDLDDEGLAFVLSHVKGIDMLDLNETSITNDGISKLTQLEYIKELRLKECSIDNDCTVDLNKIKSLEFLHVKCTAITIDGLLKLNALTNLKTLMFSADDVESIRAKMKQLKALLPGCEFVINSKPYYFDMNVSLFQFVESVNEKPWSYKLKIKNQPMVNEWSKWLTHPSYSYFETEMQGLYSVKEIEWIDIDPIEKRWIGKLMPENEYDHKDEVINELLKLGIGYTKSDNIIRLAV